jgi:hypothetical protein
VHGLVSEEQLRPDEVQRIFMDADVFNEFWRRHVDDGTVAHALHAVLAASLDPDQKPVVLYLLAERSGSVTRQLRQAITCLKPNCGGCGKIVLGEAFDGAKGNEAQPNELATSLLAYLRETAMRTRVLSVGLHELARLLDVDIAFCDVFHATKLIRNLGGRPDVHVVFPTVGGREIITLKTELRGIGVPGYLLEENKKMDDRLPIAIAYGDFIRAAFRGEHKLLAVYLIALVLPLRTLLDPEAEMTWQRRIEYMTVTFCVLLLVRLFKDSERQFTDQRRKVGGVYPPIIVLSNETLHKLLMAQTAMSTLVMMGGKVDLAAGTSQPERIDRS